MAQILARDLGVEPKFFAANRNELGDLIRNGAVDIGMSGLPVTPDYAALVRFSTPYIDETFSFVVRDHLRDRFRTWASVAALGPIRIGMPDLPYYRATLQARAPNLQLITVPRLEDMFKAGDDVVGYILPAESGSVMTQLHPEYSVVVPEPDAIKLPIAYPVSNDDERWMAFINTWLELKRHDGTLDALYRHWILGQVDSSARRRWSVIRDVLHWVD
jgi:ABC-type amino acid transport substrate-binding protein